MLYMSSQEVVKNVFCWNISSKRYLGVKDVEWMMIRGIKLLRKGSSGVVGAYVHIYIHYIHTCIQYTCLGTYIHTYRGLHTCIYTHIDTTRRAEFQSYKIKKVKRNNNNNK